MSQPLPDALRPWSTWLAPLDATLALALGALLVSLEPLLGTPRGALVDGEREPDGLGDLSRRGPYHRLLATEWALADEVPDEFLRRAASHEHLFLAPRMVSRRHGASLVAVFDAGPAQWGGPRLAHLALWILLARRADGFRRWQR